MRKKFIETLIKLAQKDKSIYLLTGDLGFSVLEEFERRFPKRYINCGVAEQSMMSLAAGLALEGKKVYAYSIVPFATFRCLEQVRNDICYHNLDVTIVGVGAGLAYGALGPTHFAIEDVSALRVLPNLTILSPADPTEMEQLLLQSYRLKSPVYLRMDKSENNFHQPKDKIILGQPSFIKRGKDGLVITTGSYLKTVMTAVKSVEKSGYNLTVLSMHTLKPVDEKYLLKIIKNHKTVFTAEEHRLMGGLGSIVGEIILKNNFKNIIFKGIGIDDIYSPIIGNQEFLKKHYKIDEKTITRKLLHYLGNEV